MMKFRLPKFWPIVLIIVIGCLLGWQLLRVGYYPMHDDLQVMRFFQMRRCFDDGQIPCRWAPDMNNNYGQPMFNYYSAFPYYFGMIFNLIGFSFVDTVKIVFLLSLLFSGVFSYLLSRRFFSISASMVAAIAYMSAPYHALDIFVRGALAESWGLVFIPAVFYTLSLVLEKPTVKYSLLLSLAVAGLLTTHTLTVLMTAPFIVLFIFLAFHIYGFSLQKIKYLFAGGLLGIGLSSFFLFPVLLEQNLIQGGKYLTADYFNFRAHFATLRQLFLNTNWAYGPSKFGPDDDISFYLGLLQTVSLIVTPFVLLKLLKTNKKTFALVLFFFLLAFAAVFMTHGKSDPIWTVVPKLAFVQFPWRYLGLAIFGTSFLLAALVNLFNKKHQQILMVLLGFLLVFLNFRYFRFEKYFYWIDDQQKLSGELYNLQVRAALLDYLPATSQNIPIDKAPAMPVIKSGEAEIDYFDKRSAYFSSEIDVEETTTIEFPVAYFPNWRVYRNRSETPFAFSYDNEFGLIAVTLEPGHHLIQGFFDNTPIRFWSNVISFASLLTIILWFSLTNAKSKKQV